MVSRRESPPGEAWFSPHSTAVWELLRLMERGSGVAVPTEAHFAIIPCLQSVSYSAVLWVYVPPQTPILQPDPEGNDIKMWDLWEVIGSWGHHPMSAISTLIE